MKRTLVIDSLVGPGVQAPKFSAEIAPAYTFVDGRQINWAVAEPIWSVDGKITVTGMEDTWDGDPLVWDINVRFDDQVPGAFVNARNMHSKRIFPDTEVVEVDLFDMIIQNPSIDPTYGPDVVTQAREARDESRAARDESVAASDAAETAQEASEAASADAGTKAFNSGQSAASALGSANDAQASEEAAATSASTAQQWAELSIVWGIDGGNASTVFTPDMITLDGGGA